MRDGLVGDAESGLRSDLVQAHIDDLLRDYHDARRREEQWRHPQMLLALSTPIITLIAVTFAAAAQNGLSMTAGAVAMVTGTAAALAAGQAWSWRRVALGLLNRYRTEYAAAPDQLFRDPL